MIKTFGPVVDGFFKKVVHDTLKQSTVLVASSASVHGVKYSADMIISVGSW